MIGATFCSGIGAPEVAAPWVDWRLASEIEPFPREVLQYRHGYKTPEDHNQGDPLLWGDMTEVTPDLMRERGVPLPDIIVAGTPCQAFSVAGLRNGVADDRGNLTLKFVETCHATVDARTDGKLTVLWENVPGVLSDKGNAFGAFLGGMVGAMDALPQPNGGWGREGMVEGPRARAAWAILDAQWFGVAQRRRRVFVVFDFGGGVDPAAVLFERDRLRGDTPPSRETGEGVAEGAALGVALRGRDGGGSAEVTGEVSGALRASTGGGDKAHVLTHEVAQSLTASGRGVDRIGETRGQDPAVTVPQWPAEVAPTLNAHFGDKMGLEDQHALSGGGFSSLPDVAICLNAGAMGRKDATTETFIPTNGGVFDVAHSLRGEGFDASEDGTGRGTPLVPIAIQERAISENPDNGPDGAGFRADGAAYTLEARHQPQAVAFAHQAGGKQTTLGATNDGTCQTLAAHQTPAVATPWAVRRLSPREAERLQGFPDDFTLIPRDRKRALKDVEDEVRYLRQTYPDMTPDQALMLAADSPRYKALGNSMAIPVVKWIMDRIRISCAKPKTQELNRRIP